VEFNTVLLVFEPLPYLGTFVIFGVVQDHVYLSTPVPGNELVQKGQKTIGVEPVDEAEVKFGLSADRYRSHHFQGLPCGRGLHHASNPLQSPVWASDFVTPSPPAVMMITRLNRLREDGLPCGPQDSLCTLRTHRSAIQVVAQSPLRSWAGCIDLFDNLLCIRNTRYGLLVRPYPAGTLTPQETPSFAWRTTNPSLD
jgi:hypothetical protein